MKKTVKNNKGITLVALVLTIIILIILAGISISVLTRQDGIINKAKSAKQNMENATLEEQEQLNTLYDRLAIGTVPVTAYDSIAQYQQQINTLQNELNTLKADLGTEAASSDKILKDYKAYVNGQLVTGTMENNGAVNATINLGETYTIPEGYHDGTGTVTMVSKTTLNTIVSGVTTYTTNQNYSVLYITTYGNGIIPNLTIDTSTANKVQVGHWGSGTNGSGYNIRFYIAYNIKSGDILSVPDNCKFWVRELV